MRTDLTDTEKAWLGGVLSSQGTFRNGIIFRASRADRKTSMRWELASSKVSLVNRVAKLLDLEPRVVFRNHKETKVVSVFGDDLQALMKMVWPWLLTYRQHQYAKVKKKSDDSITSRDTTSS